MAGIKLRTVSRTQGNNQALKDSTVTPSEFVLDFVEVPVLVQAFRRMVRGLEFDMTEMAFTTYLCAREHGTRFTALPVFLVRGLHHGAILKNRRAGIRSPKDLEGERVGVNRGYTVTTGVWARAILQEEFGVDLGRVTWLLSGDEHVEHYRPPANVVPAGPDDNIEELLASGELPAAVGVTVDHPDVAPLIPDPTKTALAAILERGFYPINHLIVVKDELLDTYPNLAADVFSAFAEAKHDYVHALGQDGIADPTSTDRMYQRVMEATGSDPLPYGIEPNRAVIEQLIDHAVTQGILRHRPEVEELFAQGTHDLTA